MGGGKSHPRHLWKLILQLLRHGPQLALAPSCWIHCTLTKHHPEAWDGAIEPTLLPGELESWEPLAYVAYEPARSGARSRSMANWQTHGCGLTILKLPTRGDHERWIVRVRLEHGLTTYMTINADIR